MTGFGSTKMLGQDLERTHGFFVVCADGADGLGHELDFRDWSPTGTFGLEFLG